MAEHTPGPWKRLETSGRQAFCAEDYDEGTGSAVANYKLALAAPELLVELEKAERALRAISKDMAEGIEFDATHAKYARRDADSAAAVIAKARGRSG